MKKKLSILLVAVMLLATLSGCTSKDTIQNSTEPAKTTNVSFHYGFLDEPPGIDPGISQGSTQSTIYATLFEGLVTVNEKGDIVPGVAERWDISVDGTEYTFHLRDGLKWSDGKVLSAKDFEYSWLRVLNPKTASTYSWFVEMFLKNGSDFAKGNVKAEEVGVKATDDKTLVVKLNMPSSYFPQALLQGCWLPVRQDIVEANPDVWTQNSSTYISNGPFKFTEYKIGSYITAVKNENYWNAESLKIDNVKFSFITDPNTAYSAFQAGDLDGIAGVPAAELVKIMTTDKRLYSYDKLAFNFIRLNNETKGLDNAKVRRAINLAIDRKAYLDGLGSLTNIPALGAVPTGLILDGKDFRKTAGDNGLSEKANLEEAKKLLAEAGYPEGKGLPTYSLHCAQKSVKGAEIIQQMLLTNLGIKSEIKPVDDKLNFPMMVEGKYDIAFGGWGGDYTHPMTFLELFTSTAYDNCTRWKNDEYDKLISDARMEADEAIALDLMLQAEKILVEESPIVPISFPSGAIMVQDNVKGWFISAKDTFYIMNVSITE